jgi:hypothetical protein
VAVLAVLPVAYSFATTAATIGLLQAANVTAYALNVASVSVPGRIDGQAQTELQGKRTDDKTYQTVYSPKKGRSLIAPAGWAFSIWGPIFAGEAVFCGSLLLQTSDAVMATLPEITAPLVAAHLLQSLWCAAFRPSYVTAGSSWEKYVSMGMLGGTAFCLSQVHAVAAASSWFFLPLTMHFGWTTAATLVNLNGSIAMSDASDTTVIAVGHASTVAATLLGVGVTLTQLSPAYGLTLAWALVACADGMKKRNAETGTVSPEIEQGMKVQQMLCHAGSGICATAAVASYFL